MEKKTVGIDMVEGMKYYIAITKSGKEIDTKLSIEERINIMNMNEFFGKILIPVFSDGKILFPRYLFVEMIKKPISIHFIKKISTIIKFMTDLNVRDEEMIIIKNSMMYHIEDKFKHVFDEGDEITISDGSFKNMKGIVRKVISGGRRVKIDVMIFGRITTVDIDCEFLCKND